MRSEPTLQLATGHLDQVRQEIGKVIVGQQHVVDGVLICLLAGGHVLLEGVPGLGKTTLAANAGPRIASEVFAYSVHAGSDARRHRRQHDYRKRRSWRQGLRFQPGPIFANLVLADEINRATPKTQSALLEAMQERTVTSGTTTHELESPFLVMATQNPIEMEGTYPLPEAQLDRFLMKILVTYPSREDLNRIVERTIHRDETDARASCRPRRHPAAAARPAGTVLIAPHVQDFAIDLVMATQPGTPSAHPLATNTSAMEVRRAARRPWWSAAACWL